MSPLSLNRSLMAHSLPPIAKVPHDVLAEVFVLCLPSHAVLPTTHFDSPVFISPSPAEPPLLLCSVSPRWRAVAISLPSLWVSLDTQNVYHPELVELWLERAKQSTLSLRISRPIRDAHTHLTPIFPPVLLHGTSYVFPMHLHLPLILPKIEQCRHLEMVDWFIPHFFPPRLSSAITLESLSMTVGPSVLGWPSPRDRAASWISQFLAHAPRLARLHWEGPDILAPWAQLTHLSWHIDLADPRHFEQTLDLLSNLIHLRLQLCVDRYRQFTTPTSVHILPNVTTYSFSGDTAVTRFLILPKLRHLILIWSHTTAPNDFDLFLERSQCAIQSLELWQHHFSRIPATLLNHPAIAPSLTRLLISSHDLNEFFCELDRSNPGILPPRLALLRDVDRCFRIEKLPGIDDDETSGVLAFIIHAQLPMLAQLDLDDREISSVSTAPELESRTVRTGDSTAFSVSRSVVLRHQYVAWWNSPAGLEFRAALDAEDLRKIRTFDVGADLLSRAPYGARNIFFTS